MLVFHETSGTERPRGADVRALVREPNGTLNVTGGTSPGQVARALAKGWDVSVDAVWAESFDKAWERGQSERWAVAFAIHYSVLAPTEFNAAPGFTANHSVVLSRGLVFDPMADRRRPGIPKGPQAWPRDLLRRASGAFNTAGIGQPYRALGNGLAYVLYAEAGATVARADPPSGPVALKFGGTARLQGTYRVTAEPSARIRSTPNATTASVGSVPPGEIVRRAVRGATLPFRVEQATDIGSNVGGSRRWLGDRTGGLWVHASLVEKLA
jgi:hypothetical protein